MGLYLYIHNQQVSLRSLTLFLPVFLAIALTALTACKSGQTGSRQKLSVVTYNKKRGNHSSSPSQRHYSARKNNSKDKYFEFDEKNPSKSRPSASDRSTNSAVSASGQARKVIQTARSYLGTPYRYSGTSRSGMDCSGLLCTSFEAASIKLPRSSREQSEYGEKVQMDDVRPGDLVFFSEHKSSNKVSHVGMVTAVNGRDDVTFIHSSTSRGVVEDNLYSEYYRKIFVKAIRPF